MDDQRRALHDVAEAARAVNRAVRITCADAATVDEAADLLRRAADLLTGAVHAGPHAQTGHGEALFAPSPSPASFFPYSPVVGPLNPIAPPVEMLIGEDGVVRGEVTLTEVFNGPPWDLTHGGVVAMIFDELLGVAGITVGGGFTGRLTVRYRKPTPIGRPLRLEARVVHRQGRKITAHGTMHDGDVLTAEAEGLFISAGGALSEHAAGHPGGDDA